MTWEYVLKLLAITAGTWFWMWFLVWEIERYRSGKPKRWWERDIREFFD